MSGRVLIAGGGTGGHVFPTLATASALKALAPDVDVEFVGTARGLESRLVPQAGWTLHEVRAAPLARRISAATLKLPFVLRQATAQVAELITARDVKVAAVFGGYVAVPLAFAARRRGIPLIVHEQNAVPGLANKLAARWAHTVAVSYQGATQAFGRRRTVLTGNPVRPEMAGVDRVTLRAEAFARFGLDPERRTLLVFGGSQGARRINDAVVGSAGLWSDPQSLQIVHACGAGEYDRISALWAQTLGAAPDGVLVRCEAFIDRMDLAYAAADVVLCRSGASSIAELTSLGLPSVLVPYPHATADHQMANAREVEAAGAALVIADEDFGSTALVAALQPLLRDPAMLRDMAAASVGFGRPHAAHELARLVLDAMREQTT